MIQKYLSEKDLKGVYGIAHKIVGNAGGYGLEGLGEIASRLELKAKTGDFGESNKCLSKMIHYLDHLQIEFKDFPEEEM